MHGYCWRFDWIHSLHLSICHFFIAFSNNFFLQKIIIGKYNSAMYMIIEFLSFHVILFSIVIKSCCYLPTSFSVALLEFGFYAGINYLLEFECYCWKACKSWLVKEIISWAWPVAHWVGMFILQIDLENCGWLSLCKSHNIKVKSYFIIFIFTFITFT